MKNKASIREVGMAAYCLDNLNTYEEAYKKNPNVFRLRANLSDEIMEIPLNPIIKNEIEKFFKERKALNQKIIDDNPKIVKIIENE